MVHLRRISSGRSRAKSRWAQVRTWRVSFWSSPMSRSLQSPPSLAAFCRRRRVTFRLQLSANRRTWPCLQLLLMYLRALRNRLLCQALHPAVFQALRRAWPLHRFLLIHPPRHLAMPLRWSRQLPRALLHRPRNQVVNQALNQPTFLVRHQVRNHPVRRVHHPLPIHLVM